jgi:hypothetical protein
MQFTIPVTELEQNELEKHQVEIIKVDISQEKRFVTMPVNSSWDLQKICLAFHSAGMERSLQLMDSVLGK